MNIALRHSLWKQYSYPWDYRIEYIHCTDYRCYLLFPWEIQEGGTPEVLSIVAATDSFPSADRKFCGSNMWFGLACYQGWRHSAFYSWDGGGGSASQQHLKFRWTVSREDGAILSDPDSGESLWTGPAASTTSENHFHDVWSPPQNHLYAYAWNDDHSINLNGQYYTWFAIGSAINVSSTADGRPVSISIDTPPTISPESAHIPYKVYDFYRTVNEKCTAHLIPCVMNGIVGMYDEIGKQFYQPTDSNYSFGEGPIINNNEGFKAGDR